MNGKVLRFPTQRVADLDRIDQIIREGMLAAEAEEGIYIPQEEVERRNYQLEDWMGLPYGTLSKSGGSSQNGQR